MEIKLCFFVQLWIVLGFATHDSEGNICYLSEIEHLNPTNCSGVEGAGLTVANHGFCLVERTGDLDAYKGSLGVWTCNQGHWSETDSYVGGGGDRGSTKFPPYIPSPCKPRDVQDNYNVRAGESGAHVSWTEPVATGRDGAATPRVLQVAGESNGGLFEGTTYGKAHNITYKAIDSDGLTAHCHFSFTVTLLTCYTLPWPANGVRNCENNNILGSSCNYTCHPGYQLSGSSTVTCENDLAPTWSNIPICEKVKCSSPSHPADRTIQCSDPTYSYQSICSVRCNDGLSLEGHVYMQCLADGTWSNDGYSTCVDNSLPTIKCITPQIFYADRAATSTSVTWKEPTAQDATGPHPTIVKTDGPSMGEVLEVGSEVVRYKAVDSDGNESPDCFIELRVEEIICGHPLDSLNDNFLVFSCTGYTYGSFCNLSCLSHLPLEGTDLITCEINGKSKGVWDWGIGDQPYCREIACPELDPPINGALVYDTIQTRPMYTMMCYDRFDIPDMGSRFNGVFFCTDHGRWTPFADVPDCIEPVNPRFLNLPAEVFYYSNGCGTEETMAQIEKQFQIILLEYLNPYLESICSTKETCKAENIVINCGPIQNRTKRALSWEYDVQEFRKKNKFRGSRREHSVQKRQSETHLLVIEFNIVNVLNLDNTTLQDAMAKYDDVQLNILKPAIQELVNNGTFDVDGFVLRNDSFQTPAYGDIKCEAGYKFDETKCKPCPVGYFWNITGCEQCPVGQYKATESKLFCSDCPVGFSTKKTGSKSQNDCTRFCSPGSYSPDALESCSPCLHGYYQDAYGQTTCKLCPFGTTTESTNSSSVTDCKSYDIFLENTNGDVRVPTISATTMTSVTFMFWSKRFDDRQSDVTLRLTNDDEDIINIYLTETIRVEIPAQVNEIVGSHSNNMWNHVAVTWDTSNSRITVYVGGDSVYVKEAATEPNIPLIENGTFVVTSSGPTGVYLTGLHLLAKGLQEPDIGNHSASCSTTESDDFINIDAFRDMEEQGISIIASSNCNATNKCLSSPCTCTCLGGWSGTTGTEPPDYCKSNACVNGATCQSGNSNYTCICLPGYTGNFCEVRPADGGWSEWTLWTECSKSCGSGTQNRTRQCNSPLPDTFGRYCEGDFTEVSSCNTVDCPVCKELERKFGTLLNCTTDYVSSSVTCVLYCEEDRFMPPGLREFQTYTCGPDTNYAWDSLGNLPSCVGPVGPRNANITVSLDYTSVILDSSKQSVMDVVNYNLAATPCRNYPNCQTEVVITSKDSTGSTVSVTFGIPLLHGPDIEYGAYVSSGKVSDALQELKDAIVNLESTVKYLQSYTVEIFDVTTKDVTLTSVPNTLKVDAILICDSGCASFGVFCLRCPTGTYSDNGVCNFCDKGSYQEHVGQTSCTKCPYGLTTTTIGSTNRSQCTKEEVSTSTEPTTVTSSPGHIEDKRTVYIAITVAALALIVAAAAIGIVVKNKMIRSSSRYNGAVKDNGIQPGKAKKYKKSGHLDVLSPTPTLTKMAVSGDYMPCVDAAESLDISVYNCSSQLYLNPVHVPEYTEKDENAYDSTYEQINNIAPLNLAHQ